MTLIRRDIPIVPFYDPLVHTAKAYPMRARVVGADNETIHADAWGRIKVQFLFSRAQDNSHSGGAGSSGSDSDSAWVDVLTPWAGDGEASYGARFLPRVGDRISITDQEDSVQYALDVVGVWFDDNYGDDHIEVVVQCDVAGQTSVATDH
ncbi:MAG: hypothetical protein EOP02_21045 [Proteobacteria bacterium]|nr:MAG: hypothetical protein EOP02_21045 [Pseudomonadota bacterium]